MKTGVELIADERIRQVDVERYNAGHDKMHKHGELACAAAAYATPDRLREKFKNGKPRLFPFAIKDWKPLRTPQFNREGRIRELVKAGALIAAEIDRLQGSGRY